MPAHRRPSPATSRARTALLPLVVALVAATVLTLFAWPAARQAPHDLPIGLAGPPSATGAVQKRLAARPGAFDVRAFAGARQARAAIEDRAVYGAVVLSPRATTVLTASAASPVVAQLLREAVAATPPAGAGPPVRVVDVVPAPAEDPRGAGLAASVLPLLLVGVIAGAAATALFASTGARAGALVVLAGVAGLAATAVAQGWLGVLEGGWLANAGALSLVVLAVGAVEAGLAAWLGHLGGTALTAVLMVLVGNPWSGVASAPALLPEPLGWIGQLLPPGAGGTLLRSTAFFDGRGAGAALVVLAAWAAAGLAALVLAGRRRRDPAVDTPLPAEAGSGLRAAA